MAMIPGQEKYSALTDSTRDIEDRQAEYAALTPPEKTEYAEYELRTKLEPLGLGLEGVSQDELYRLASKLSVTSIGRFADRRINWEPAEDLTFDGLRDLVLSDLKIDHDSSAWSEGQYEPRPLEALGLQRDEGTVSNKLDQYVSYIYDHGLQTTIAKNLDKADGSDACHWCSNIDRALAMGWTEQGFSYANDAVPYTAENRAKVALAAKARHHFVEFGHIMPKVLVNGKETSSSLRQLWTPPAAEDLNASMTTAIGQAEHGDIVTLPDGNYVAGEDGELVRTADSIRGTDGDYTYLGYEYAAPGFGYKFARHSGAMNLDISADELADIKLSSTDELGGNLLRTDFTSKFFHGDELSGTEDFSAHRPAGWLGESVDKDDGIETYTIINGSDDIKHIRGDGSAFEGFDIDDDTGEVTMNGSPITGGELLESIWGDDNGYSRNHAGDLVYKTTGGWEFSENLGWYYPAGGGWNFFSDSSSGDDRSADGSWGWFSQEQKEGGDYYYFRDAENPDEGNWLLKPAPGIYKSWDDKDPGYKATTWVKTDGNHVQTAGTERISSQPEQIGTAGTETAKEALITAEGHLQDVLGRLEKREARRQTESGQAEIKAAKDAVTAAQAKVDAEAAAQAAAAGDVDTGDVDTGDVDTGDVDTGEDTGDVDTGDVGTGDVGTGDVGTGDVGTGDVEEWTLPEGYEDGYVTGEVTHYNGQYWVNDSAENNLLEPTLENGWRQLSPEEIIGEVGNQTEGFKPVTPAFMGFTGDDGYTAAYNQAINFARQNPIDEETGRPAEWNRSILSKIWDKVHRGSNPFRWLDDFMGGNENLDRKLAFDAAWDEQADHQAYKARMSNIAYEVQLGGGPWADPSADPISQALEYLQPYYKRDKNGNIEYEGTEPVRNPLWIEGNSIYDIDENGNERSWSPSGWLPFDFKKHEWRLRDALKTEGGKYLDMFTKQDADGKTHNERVYEANKGFMTEAGILNEDPTKSLLGKASVDATNYLYGDKDAPGSLAHINDQYVGARKYYDQNLADMEDANWRDKQRRRAPFINAQADTSYVRDARTRAGERIGKAKFFGGTMNQSDFSNAQGGPRTALNLPDPSSYADGTNTIFGNLEAANKPSFSGLPATNMFSKPQPAQNAGSGPADVAAAAGPDIFGPNNMFKPQGQAGIFSQSPENAEAKQNPVYTIKGTASQ
jgi:hypothetical protein